MAGDYMSDYGTITVDDVEYVVTEEMIFGGSYSCMTCNALSRESVNIAGTLHWICPSGHKNKVVLYE
jgi:hypothetical protein